jgi:hypothetical protein
MQGILYIQALGDFTRVGLALESLLQRRLVSLGELFNILILIHTTV